MHPLRCTDINNTEYVISMREIVYATMSQCRKATDWGNKDQTITAAYLYEVKIELRQSMPIHLTFPNKKKAADVYETLAGYIYEKDKGVEAWA